MTCVDLSSMRTALASLYTQSCTIERDTLVSDGAGGHTTTVTTVASAVPCLVEVRGAARDEQVLAEQVHGLKLWDISMAIPVGYVVLGHDRIRIGSTVYEVVNTNAGEGYAIDLVVTCLQGA